MNRKEAEAYVYESYLAAQAYQDYHKPDKEKRNPQLSRDIIRSMAGTPCAAITGSKGKGSVACMISQILQSEMRVGMMTSPHIKAFNERFKINGESISDEDFVRHTERVKSLFDTIAVRPEAGECISPMGIQTAIALSYFNENKTDFNVFELGKGARYDDVNNTAHDYAVINTIFLEHTRELGKTLSEIADNKAAIIDGGQKCVYVAEQDDEVMRRIAERAKEYKTPLRVYGRDFYADNIRFTKEGMKFDATVGKRRLEGIRIPLLGEHQAKNCALALAMSLDVLKKPDPEAIKHALYFMRWPGRMEIISEKPFILVDACINRASCRGVLSTLKELGTDRVTLILGIPDDKDYAGVAAEMAGVSARVILTKVSNPHYVFTDRQKDRLSDMKIPVMTAGGAAQALNMALGFEEPVVILGTTALIAEL